VFPGLLLTPVRVPELGRLSPFSLCSSRREGVGTPFSLCSSRREGVGTPFSLCSSRREGVGTLHLRLTVSEGHMYPLVMRMEKRVPQVPKGYKIEPSPMQH
jgi:hypothetical protein